MGSNIVSTMGGGAELGGVSVSEEGGICGGWNGNEDGKVIEGGGEA